MRTSSLLLQATVLAVAVHFACYFTYDATLPFSVVTEPDLAHISAVMTLARLFSLGSAGAFFFISVLSALKWGTAVLLVAHIADRGTKLEGGRVNAGLFDLSVMLCVLILALTMAGAILAQDTHVMWLSGLQMVAVAVMALASDLLQRWSAPANQDDLAEAPVADFPLDTPTVVITLPAQNAEGLYQRRWVARIQTASFVRWSEAMSRNM